jgi:hypothetical protein
MHMNLLCSIFIFGAQVLVRSSLGGGALKCSSAGAQNGSKIAQTNITKRLTYII